MSDLEPQVAEMLTRWTVRLAIACYFGRVAVDLGLLCEWPTLSASKTNRRIWTIGCLLYLLHVVCAFAFFHDWSHEQAITHTAEQTGALTGFHWGGGVYFNYAFTLLWIADSIAWWTTGVEKHYGSRRYFWTLHFVFAFMVFNATVVFGPPMWRWAIPVAGVALAIVYFRARRGRNPLG